MPSAPDLNQWSQGFFPGHLDITVTSADTGRLVVEMPVSQRLLAPNGYLHGGAVASIADTACGYGCMTSLPEGATGFTTIELKTNFTGTARDGVATCEATLVHGGRTTQVWDATVRTREGAAIAHFRCTQLIVYP